MFLARFRREQLTTCRSRVRNRIYDFKLFRRLSRACLVTYALRTTPRRDSSLRHWLRHYYRRCSCPWNSRSWLPRTRYLFCARVRRRTGQGRGNLRKITYRKFFIRRVTRALVGALQRWHLLLDVILKVLKPLVDLPKKAGHFRSKIFFQ